MRGHLCIVASGTAQDKVGGDIVRALSPPEPHLPVLAVSPSGGTCYVRQQTDKEGA